MKKTLRTLLIFGSYALVVGCIVLATVALVAYGQGYSYDFKNHRIVSNGLLILVSTPSGIQVSIDGKTQRRKTPYRETLRAGDHVVRLQKDGYRVWTKRISVVASQVTNLATVLLIPEKIRSSIITNSANVSSVVTSPDQKHVFYVTAGAAAGVWQLNVDRARGDKVFTPAPTTDAPAEVVQSLSVSADGSRVLLRLQRDDTQRVVLVTANTGEALDLTDTFRVDLADVRFSNYDAQQLYWLSSDGLRRIDVGARTMSAVLADKVAAFTYAGNRILYIQTTSAGKIVGVMDRDGRNARTILDGVPESDGYGLAYGKFRDSDMLALLPRSSKQLTLYSDIFTDTPTAKVIARDIDSVVVSPDGHYVVFADAQSVRGYDVLHGKISPATFHGAITSLQWFNGSHIVLGSGGYSFVAEFDGDNATSLAQSASTVATVGLADAHHVLYAEPAVSGGLQLRLADLRK